MPKASKFSPDEGLTIYDLKDSEAVHYGNQSKGYVGKNMLKNTATGGSVNGVSWTINADGTVTANNKATSNSVLIIGKIENFTGTVIVSGCPSGGGGSSYEIQLKIDGNWADYHEYGSGDLTLSMSSSHYYEIVCIVRNNYTANNLIFSPMVRLMSISDKEYEPYIHPNTEIPDKMSYADNAILGAKNLLNIKSSIVSKSFRGVDWTITRNSNGEVVEIDANGTATGGNSFLDIGFSSDFPFTGNFILSGCPQNGSDNSYRINFYNSTNLSYIFDYGSGANIPIDGSFNWVVSPSIMNGFHADHIKFYPMIRLASDSDDTYAPYAMTNRELTKVSEVPISIPSALSSKITLNANSKVYRQGNVVTGSIRISITDTLSAGSDLCDLGGIKPKYLTYTSGIKNSDGSVMPVIQNTTGRIVLFGQFIPAVGSDLIIPINYMCE